MKTTFEYLAGLTPRRSYESSAPAPLYKYVNRARPDAVKGITNCFGIALFDVSGDECIAAYWNGAGYTNAHRHAIHYSSSGRPYIRKSSSRFYLDEFTRAIA